MQKFRIHPRILVLHLSDSPVVGPVRAHVASSDTTTRLDGRRPSLASVTLVIGPSPRLALALYRHQFFPR